MDRLTGAGFAMKEVAEISRDRLSAMALLEGRAPALGVIPSPASSQGLGDAEVSDAPPTERPTHPP